MSSVCIGTLLDVSESMRNSIGDGIDEEDGTWAHSIFTVADDLVKYDVSDSNKVFVIGFGARFFPVTFDILSTIKHCQTTGDQQVSLEDLQKPATFETIGKILKILTSSGATSITSWIDVDIVGNILSEYMALVFLNKLETDRNFRSKFVNDDLPPVCRISKSCCESLHQRILSNAVAPFVKASEEEIKEVLSRAMVCSVSDQSVYDVKIAEGILTGCMEEQELTSQRVRTLLKHIEPFIYGLTPLFSALRDALMCFERSESAFSISDKLLCIVSDGNPTDIGLKELQSKLSGKSITIVSCFISNERTIEPRRMYSESKMYWDVGAKVLFGLSSCIPTSLVTRAIFIKNNWKFDINSNETRLFMHVNHPDHLKDVCNLARNAVCCQDALSEVLVSVSLDLYINDKNSSVKVYNQGGDGTCYAHASATVLHLAMSRILGRNSGYPAFEELRDEIIQQHGIHGANTFNVLEGVCPRYRLRCREVDVRGAMKAITEKRLLVARFRLNETEWDKFYEFFRLSPNGILTTKDLDISLRLGGDILSGHAVVLSSFNSKGLHLMNSWGDKWGDNGFFRIQNADVLEMDFIDVFWNEDDLSQSEKTFYKQHGSRVATILMGYLRALQFAKFTCPNCRKSSPVDKFSGTLTEVFCPQCKKGFSSYDGIGNMLALNVYLTSISR